MEEGTLRRVMTRLLQHSGGNFHRGAPSDHLPCVTVLAYRAPCSYIANSDPCTELDSHWVAFFHSSPKSLEFFDSYGKTPAYYGLSIPNTMAVNYNTLQLQADSSLLCGQWCILFLHRRAQGTSFNTLIRRFSSLTPKKADAHVQTYYSQLLYQLNRQYLASLLYHMRLLLSPLLRMLLHRFPLLRQVLRLHHCCLHLVRQLCAQVVSPLA